MAAQGGEAQASAAVGRWRALAGVRPDVWPCGVQVKLHGLSKEDLNGEVCSVVGVDLQSDRVRVHLLPADKVIAVRRENCAQRLRARVGDRVVEVRPAEDGYKAEGEEEALPAADVVPL